ncbi:C-8 sterol isomerase [Pleurotus eryngii]|uniref:C-8 sterol isomerase n=1 Tax=Pleurotus eryngii TaxID=5323 RepID=A0A9P6A1Y5_PLEER|nr:C-8 sterol isomerase [Pleurotus eryngii]
MSSTKKSGARKSTEERRDPIMKWATRVVILALFLAFCGWLDIIKDRWYVFEPSKLHALAQDAIAAHPDDTGAMVHHIVSNLTAEYPSSQIRINPNEREWVFNNAGGAMGGMYIIHASITEYLIIFGTPLGTEGHSGIHTADDYFHILSGEQWAYTLGSFEKEVYTAGSVHLMPRGVRKQYKMHKGCFALEYARGWIPLMLPFGFADAISSTMDYISAYDTVRATGREIIKNLLIGKI